MSDDDDFLILTDRLTEKPQVFEGVFTLPDLERLEGAVNEEGGELRYRITAQLDARQRKVASCIIEGFVFLTCQSSLEAFRHDIAVRDKLVFVDSEAQLPGIEEESDEEDFLVADEPVDIRDLVEDAVLLALPMVPRKPGLEEAKHEDDKAWKESPFSKLAGLKRDKDNG